MTDTHKDKLLLYTTPLVILLLLILAFGLMIPWLGYGFDEWHFIYYSTRGSEGLAELFHYDGHPQATWSYIQSFNLLGYTPFYWHLYSLIWRWLGVLSFWLCLRRVWQNHHRQNFLITALFAVFPAFTLQIFPISFFEVWVGYTLLFLSFFFTILAIQKPEKQIVFSSLAILLTLGHVFTREYAWFVELMRPVMIWLVSSSKETWQKKTLATFKRWLPFFLIFASSLIWRGFFYTPLRKYFQVDSSIFTNPFNTLLTWVTDLIPDLSILLITSWYETLRPEYIYFVRPLNIALTILMILIATLGFFYARKIDNFSQNTISWTTQAVFLGLPSLLFGILPFYIASYSLHLTDPPHNSRLVIGMLPGAALLSVALIEKIIARPNLKILIVVTMLSVSMGWHLRYTNDFRKVWDYQADFLQQMTWRVPSMEKNTAIFVWQPSLPSLHTSLADIALYTDFSVSMAINSIYQINPEPAENRLSYWYYSEPVDVANMMQDVPLYSEHATTYFEGNTLKSLFFYYAPENNRCLHLITPEDEFYKQYPDLVKEVAPYTTTDRISQVEKQNIGLRDDILNKTENAWCFYYQKADLARQYQQWGEIPFLWQGVEQNHLRASIGTEYIPFIDGFAHVGDWQKAMEITFAADKISKAMESILCRLWDNIEKSTSTSEGRDEVIRQVRLELECVMQ